MATWLVVGLGNPGPTYAFTRHNVGHMVVDQIVAEARGTFSVQRLQKADVCETRITRADSWGGIGEAERVVVMKSRGFMNESGGPVVAVARHHKVDPAHIIVIHDELDIDFGRIRTKLGGGDNGHNGLKSIRASLSTGDFYRVRYGIGRPPGRMDTADYVLAQIPGALREDYGAQTGRVADAVATLILDGLDAAQQKFNS
ncbi:MAG: aminoacyl-tRNA hydrolase [Propionibacteriaceae bacterium]